MKKCFLDYQLTVFGLGQWGSHGGGSGAAVAAAVAAAAGWSTTDSSQTFLTAYTGAVFV